MLIGNTSINTLLYADDLVLLSSSPQGLQNFLEKLSVFCASLKLEVNISKSKALIFNSNGKSFSNHFYYNNSIIQTVTQYCYLGITLKYNGNFGLVTSILMEKARKALFKIKKSIGLNNPCKLLEKLFDSIIVPIMFYGCEIWGIESVLKCKDSEPHEKFHVNLLKNYLEFTVKVENVACRSALGRLPINTKKYHGFY